jgi:hypothetical protein
MILESCLPLWLLVGVAGNASKTCLDTGAAVLDGFQRLERLQDTLLAETRRTNSLLETMTMTRVG